MRCGLAMALVVGCAASEAQVPVALESQPDREPPVPSAADCERAMKLERETYHAWLTDDSGFSQSRIYDQLDAWGLDARTDPVSLRVTRLPLEGTRHVTPLLGVLQDLMRETADQCLPPGVGRPCTSAQECTPRAPRCMLADNRGMLSAGEGLGVCTAECERGCPASWRCQRLLYVRARPTLAGASVEEVDESLCAPGSHQRGRGEPCDAHRDCAEESPWCLGTCALPCNTACPEGRLYCKPNEIAANGGCPDDLVCRLERIDPYDMMSERRELCVEP